MIVQGNDYNNFEASVKVECKDVEVMFDGSVRCIGVEKYSKGRTNNFREEKNFIGDHAVLSSSRYHTITY